MPPFSVNPTRFDPYGRFRFRVLWDGRAVAGVTRVGPLRRVTEVAEHRSGGEPALERRAPGRTGYDAVRLERGRTHDDAFERWADAVWRLGAPAGAEVALAAFRKDVRIELLNEAGQVALAFVLHRCWPAEYVALGPLDAGDGLRAVESLVLVHEGFERDRAVPEPKEPETTEG